MYDDDDEPEGPKSSFTTYLSEGNVHFNQGEYKKALDSYTQVNGRLSYFPSPKFARFITIFMHLISLFYLQMSTVLDLRLTLPKQNKKVAHY